MTPRESAQLFRLTQKRDHYTVTNDSHKTHNRFFPLFISIRLFDDVSLDSIPKAVRGRYYSHCDLPLPDSAPVVDCVT